MSSRLDHDNVIGRFAGFYWYDHDHDKAILAWLDDKEAQGISKTAAIKDAVYRVASNQVDAGDVGRAIDGLRGDVAEIRSLIKKGWMPEPGAQMVEDDVSDIADALAGFGT